MTGRNSHMGKGLLYPTNKCLGQVCSNGLFLVVVTAKKIQGKNPFELNTFYIDFNISLFAYLKIMGCVLSANYMKRFLAVEVY